MNELEPLQKHTLNIFAGDFDRLQRLHPEVGAAAVVRRLIRKHLEENELPVDLSKIKEKVNV